MTDEMVSVESMGSDARSDTELRGDTAVGSSVKKLVELHKSPFLAVILLCTMIYVIISYTRNILVERFEFVNTVTLLFIALFSLLYCVITISRKFYNTQKHMRRFIPPLASGSTLLATGSFLLSGYGDNFQHASFFLSIIGALCITYLLVRGAPLETASWNQLIRIIQHWASLPVPSIQVFVPTNVDYGTVNISELTDIASGADSIHLGAHGIGKLSGYGKIAAAVNVTVAQASARAVQKVEDAGGSVTIFGGGIESEFGFDLSSGIGKSNAIDDPISSSPLPLRECAFFIRAGAFSHPSPGNTYYVPAISSAIERLSFDYDWPIKQGSATKEVEDNTLAQLLLLLIFQNITNPEDRWVKHSASTLAATNKTIDINIDGGYVIRHNWNYAQLSRAAAMLFKQLIVPKGPGNAISAPHLKHWLIHVLSELSRIDPLEHNKVLHYLAILSGISSSEFPHNNARWEGMVEGFCVGCQFSIGDLTTDTDIKKNAEKLSGNSWKTELSDRVDNAFKNPIDEFVNVHDALIELFYHDKKYDEDENQYIDGVIEAMMKLLHHTSYLERQVKRQKMSAEELVEKRKGIIAGISVSMSVVRETLKVNK